MALTHVNVLSMADWPADEVTGLRAQVRTVRDVPDWAPMWRTLIGVRRYWEDGREWVEIRWERDSSRGYDCGFSGMTVDLARNRPWSIEVEGR